MALRVQKGGPFGIIIIYSVVHQALHRLWGLTNFLASSQIEAATGSHESFHHNLSIAHLFKPLPHI